MITRVFVKRLFVVGLLLAISSDGVARQGLISSTRQAIKQHGARTIATAGALLMLCAGGCEQMPRKIFTGSDDPADTSAGSIELFRSIGETGSYVGSSVDYVVRAPGEDEVLRRERVAGVTIAYHERDDIGDLVIDIVDSDQGVLSDRHYLALVEDNGSYTIYDRIGPGRVGIGGGTTESDHLRLNFTAELVGGQVAVVAYLYNPITDQANDRVGRQLRLEYLNRPLGFGRSDIEVSSQMFWSDSQTVIAQSQPTTVGLRSIGDMYRQSYLSGGEHTKNVKKIFSTTDGFIQLFAQSGQPSEFIEDLGITTYESYDSSSNIDNLAIYIDRGSESMEFNLTLRWDNTGKFDIYDSEGEALGGKGEMSDDDLRLDFNDHNGTIFVKLSSPVLSSTTVSRETTIRVTPPTPTSVFGQSSAAQTVFRGMTRWDAKTSAQLSN